MKKSLEELIKLLEKECVQVSLTNSQEVFSKLNEKYNFPVKLSNDIINNRKSLEEFTSYELFCVLDVIDSDKVHTYFTDIEIETFRATKYKVPKLKFPIIFDNVAKVADDQYLTVIPVEKAMLLKNAGIVNYNKNAQRTLTRVIKGNREEYRITLNKRSVKDITNAMLSGTYIPDTITLGLPLDAEYSYSDGEFSIKNLGASGCFDIYDGYHRWVAMSKAYRENPNIDLVMELRLAIYPINKAQQFIWQEDQKTKMSKVSSDTMNQYDSSNIIVNRLNEDPLSDIQGLVSRNNGIIDFADLSGLIHYFYFRNRMSKNEEKSKVLGLVPKLRNGINGIIEANPELIQTKIPYSSLLAMMFVIANEEQESSKENNTIFLNAINILKDFDEKIVNSRPPRRAVINQLNTLI